jgi:hypothetical protein
MLADLHMRWARVSLPVSGGQGVAGSNPAVPTVFRTLLRHVQQQYSSTRGRLLKVCMRPLSGRHAAGGFKITTLGGGGFASRMLRVVRHERRTPLTASPGCWHAYQVGVSAVLTLAPGSSPWRLQSAHGGTPAYVTDGDGRAGMRRARSADMGRRWIVHT